MGSERPAVVSGDLLEADLLVAVMRMRHHVLVVTVGRVVNVFVLRDQVNVQNPDVHAKSRLAVPVEVVRLQENK